MGRLPRAPLRKLHDQVVAVGLRGRRTIDAAFARRGYYPGERAREPHGGGRKEASRHAGGWGGGRRGLAHAIPFSGVGRRRAAPRLAPGGGYTSRRPRPEPLADPEGRSYQVRWCLLHPTPPGIEWAHDGARHRSRHRTSSLLRSRGVVKAVLSSAPEPRVEDVAERVAEHVEPEHGHRD